ncbi:4-hydroxy-tetrahydrodipicolinate synthase [Bosea sp. LjRoot9]|uniref:4-hydroxy-tetrahydrodipicolinate synthase n=1 Tax=Bosea sp. LjRoot9 TaxID=3342341 RepID=UPI003ECD35E0
MNHWLHGMFTALVTPFDGSSIDDKALCRLVAWQVGQGANGIVVGSATGEDSTLTTGERWHVLALIRAAAGPTFPVIAAVGSNATAATVREIEWATQAGANAILLRTPYYNRPSQAGVVQHLRSAAEATTLDIVLDNDPDRCGIEISTDALAELSQTPNIVGVLERRGDLVRCDRIARACSRQFMRLTGAADTIPAFMLSGGCGAISSIGNVAPGLLSRMQAALREGAYERAQVLQRRLIPLHHLLASQPDPIVVKLAVSLQHAGIKPDCRSPLTPAVPELVEELRHALDDSPRPKAAESAGADSPGKADLCGAYAHIRHRY